MTQIDGFILIGGRSSRLGRAKAFVDLGGQTLAERAFETVKGALPDSRVTFVAANEAQFGIEAVRASGPFIFDLVPDRGPLGGLHAALAYAHTEWIFVLACDYPFVSSEMIRLLVSYISADFGAVLPEQADGRLQPLCAFYRKAIAGPIVDAIMEQPRVPPPLHELVGRMTPRRVVFEEYNYLKQAEDLFININSATDLDRARKIERKLSARK